MGKHLKSERRQAANGRRLYEISNASARFILKAGEVLRDQFGFGPLTTPIQGPDGVITDCQRCDAKLLLGWDVWCGFSIMADTPNEDRLVDEVGDFIDSILDAPGMAEYRDTGD